MWINVADPELKPYGADGVAECQARLSVPRSGIRRACAGEKITGPKRDEAVESEKCRRGSSDSVVGPLALCLDAQVSARFGERDLDLPSADVQRDDVGGFEGDIGTEEGLRLALCCAATTRMSGRVASPTYVPEAAGIASSEMLP